ncbi:LPS-assembly lipoprotein LptE [Frateuria aurantia]
MTAGKRSRNFGLAVAAVLPLCLSGCGFHLRGSVPLPPGMTHIHLKVGTSMLAFRRALERNLELSGAVLEDESGPGVAEMDVPVVAFTNDMKTLGGYTQVTEYTVRFQVQFFVNNDKGEPIIGRQRLLMEREYSVQSNQTIGTSGQVEQLETGMVDDMVESLMLKVRAATLHPEAAKRADPTAVPPPGDTMLGHPGNTVI